MSFFELITHKAFSYRVYLTPSQRQRCLQWEGALRYLWNTSNAQRLEKLEAVEKQPTAFDQINGLTALRKNLPWLEDVPRNVSTQLLVELDKAWQRCFKKLARAPRWKRKGKDTLSLTESHPKVWRLDGDTLRFPKLGNFRTVVHRPLEGKPKTCTLKRDGDQWFAHIVCEIETPDPTPRIEPTTAIDRGITNLLANSEGKLTPNPRFYQKTMKRLARAQRTVARRQKGSKRLAKAKDRVMRLQRKTRRQRHHVLHVESYRLAKNHGIVGIEQLNVAGMIRNRRFSRNISDAGWSTFAYMLRYKLEWSGGSLVEVPAAYSSQTCFVCKHIDANSRKGEVFCCTACGHVDHADVNAAKVLKSRMNQSALPVETSTPVGLRSGKVKKKLRVPRRPSLQSPSL